MAKSRGHLEAAKIYDLAENITVDCMFNPYEYRVSNRHFLTGRNQSSHYQATYTMGPQTHFGAVFRYGQ
jgi:hypothetical protein